ncbi:MAG: LPS-assembly protein LptD [Bacteroidetes bacterium]|nr:LPS-assembly protein LptD [Bacteroidota bacterium]
MKFFVCAILLAFAMPPGALNAQIEPDSTARDRGGIVPDSTARDTGGVVLDSTARDTGTLADDSTASRPPLTVAQKDSLRLAMEDSLRLRADSLRFEGDSVTVFATSNEVDTIIVYSAKDSVIYLLDDKKMHMYEKGSIDYGATAVRADRITINWDASTIEARGVPDTTGEGGMIGTPVFREGSEEYTGEEMTYNFRTKKGVITKGETAIDDGFYLGERIKRISEDEYFISGGRYTTCDNPDHKHYYFGSAQMKFVPNEVIVARPITFYVEDIPLLWLPFAVIPSSGGRSSGIIFPSFGSDPSRGRYLKNGGYYLAMSDYWDLSLTGDVFTKGGWLARANLRYALRYNFSGSVTASYGRQNRQIGNVFRPDDPMQTEWSLQISHNQEIDPTSRITADVNILTQEYYNSFSTNLNDLLRTNARSSASYSKSWEGTNRSISVGLQRDQDLVNGTSTTTLPDIRFNQSQIYPFRGDGGFGDQAWYEMIGFSYSGQFLNRLETNEVQKYDAALDSTVSGKENFDRRGVQHRISLISTPKFGYFTISPSFTYQERWYDHRTERFFNEERRVLDARDAGGFFAVRTFNAGLSASTKLYGMFEPNALGIIGFRHTLQPSVSYSWNPDFSKESWGYYQSYTDSTGQDVRYDPYTGYSYLPGEVFGGVGSGESQTMGLRLSNIFEMKLDPLADDSTQTPRKFQLFTLDASTNYNFVKDSMRLGNLSLSYRTSIQNLLELQGGATFSPYVFIRDRQEVDDDGTLRTITGREIGQYMWEAGQGPARLTEFNIRLNTSLSHTMFKSEKEEATDQGAGSDEEEEDTGRSRRRSSAIDLDAPYNFSIPWNLSLGYDYRVSRFNPDRETRNSNLRANMTFSLTPSWHFTVSGYYDIFNKELGAPSINIRKDLHCWEMDFQWVPGGVYRSFFFVLRLKSPQLQDIKLEKRGSDRAVY